MLSIRLLEQPPKRRFCNAPRMATCPINRHNPLALVPNAADRAQVAGLSTHKLLDGNCSLASRWTSLIAVASSDESAVSAQLLRSTLLHSVAAAGLPRSFAWESSSARHKFLQLPDHIRFVNYRFRQQGHKLLTLRLAQRVQFSKSHDTPPYLPQDRRYVGLYQ